MIENIDKKIEASNPSSGRFESDYVLPDLDPDTIIEIERLSAIIRVWSEYSPEDFSLTDGEAPKFTDDEAKETIGQVNAAKDLLFADPGSAEARDLACDSVPIVRNHFLPMARNIRASHTRAARNVDNLDQSVSQLLSTMEVTGAISPTDVQNVYELAGKLKKSFPAKDFMRTALELVKAEMTAGKIHAITDLMEQNPAMAKEFKERLGLLQEADGKQEEYLKDQILPQMVARAFVTKSRLSQHRPLRRVTLEARGIEEANAYFNRLDSRVNNLIRRIPEQAIGKLYGVITAIKSEDEGTSEAVEEYLEGHLQAASLLLQRLGIELPDEHKILDAEEATQTAA